MWLAPDDASRPLLARANYGRMFRLAYLSFIGALLSAPVHFIADFKHSQWAVLGLFVLAGAFLTAGMMRRP